MYSRFRGETISSCYAEPPRAAWLISYALSTILANLRIDRRARAPPEGIPVRKQPFAGESQTPVLTTYNQTLNNLNLSSIWLIGKEDHHAHATAHVLKDAAVADVYLAIVYLEVV